MAILPNARHERFAQELAKGVSAAEAYEKAGFKPNRHNAAALARQQHILDRLNFLLAERERMHGQATAKAIDKLALTKEWIVATLMDNVQRAMQAKAPMNENGEPIGEYAYQGSVANKALELLGRELGMFIERKDVRVVDEFEGIDDPAELRRLLAARAEEIGQGDIASAIAGGKVTSGGKLN